MLSSFAFFFPKKIVLIQNGFLPWLFCLIRSDDKDVDAVIGRMAVKRTQKTTEAGHGGETGSNLRNSKLPFAMPPNPGLFLPGDTIMVERTQYRLSSQQKVLNSFWEHITKWKGTLCCFCYFLTRLIFKPEYQLCCQTWSSNNNIKYCVQFHFVIVEKEQICGTTAHSTPGGHTRKQELSRMPPFEKKKEKHISEQINQSLKSMFWKNPSTQYQHSCSHTLMSTTWKCHMLIPSIPTLTLTALMHRNIPCPQVRNVCTNRGWRIYPPPPPRSSWLPRKWVGQSLHFMQSTCFVHSETWTTLMSGILIHRTGVRSNNIKKNALGTDIVNLKKKRKKRKEMQSPHTLKLQLVRQLTHTRTYRARKSLQFYSPE